VLHLHVLLQAADARIEEVGTLQPQQRLVSAICLRHISVNNKLLQPAHLIHKFVFSSMTHAYHARNYYSSDLHLSTSSKSP